MRDSKPSKSSKRSNFLAHLHGHLVVRLRTFFLQEISSNSNSNGNRSNSNSNCNSSNRHHHHLQEHHHHHHRHRSRHRHLQHRSSNSP